MKKEIHFGEKCCKKLSNEPFLRLVTFAYCQIVGNTTSNSYKEGGKNEKRGKVYRY